MATNNAINANATGIAKYDGAGTWSATTVTDHSVIIGGTSNALTSLALTNGQLAIGNTGADPTAATLTAGTGISITNGAGSITINGVGGGLSWSVITADQTAASNHGYFCNKGSLLTLTLPTTTAVGDIIAVVNINGAAFSKVLSANPGTINFGNVVATANTGSLTSTQLGDVVFLVAQTTTSIWYVFGAQGNWTIA